MLPKLRRSRKGKRRGPPQTSELRARSKNARNVFEHRQQTRPTVVWESKVPLPSGLLGPRFGLTFRPSKTSKRSNAPRLYVPFLQPPIVLFLLLKALLQGHQTRTGTCRNQINFQRASRNNDEPISCACKTTFCTSKKSPSTPKEGRKVLQPLLDSIHGQQNCHWNRQIVVVPRTCSFHNSGDAGVRQHQTEREKGTNAETKQEEVGCGAGPHKNATHTAFHGLLRRQWHLVGVATKPIANDGSHSVSNTDSTHHNAGLHSLKAHQTQKYEHSGKLHRTKEQFRW